MAREHLPVAQLRIVVRLGASRERRALRAVQQEREQLALAQAQCRAAQQALATIEADTARARMTLTQGAVTTAAAVGITAYLSTRAQASRSAAMELHRVDNEAEASSAQLRQAKEAWRRESQRQQQQTEQVSIMEKRLAVAEESRREESAGEEHLLAWNAGRAPTGSSP